MSPHIRTYHELEASTSDLGEQVSGQAARVTSRLSSIDRVAAVMSGKGGVGKSLVTASLATALARAGRRVGVIDADLNGPSIPRMLGVGSAPLLTMDDGVEPVRTADGIAVMSMSFIVKDGTALDWHEPGGASFVWRGAQERGALREFLADVRWGALDVLLLDLPPGTQRLQDLHGMVPDLAGVLAVTIPSGASRDAVGRSLELCRRRGISVFGVVENFAGTRCSSCGDITPLYMGQAGVELGDTFDTPVLARLLHDAHLGLAAERGMLSDWISGGSETAREVTALAERVGALLVGIETGEGTT